MTMTGRTMPTQIRDEFDPQEGEIPWGHNYGAIDASPIIPAGSMVAQFQGARGFGMPRVVAREKRK